MNAAACSADKSPDLRTYLRRAFDIDELDEGEAIAIVTEGEYDGKTVYPAVSCTDKLLKSMARSKNTKATYFCVSTVQAVEAGKKLGRGKADCRTAYVVALDDVGNPEKVTSVPSTRGSSRPSATWSRRCGGSWLRRSNVRARARRRSTSRAT